MTIAFKDPVTSRIMEFLKEIGLEIEHVQIDAETFLPGILVKEGKLLTDEAKLTYPGDLLHEAGHLAVAPQCDRSTLSGEVALPGVLMEAVEAQAIAWSYAAILHLGLDPTVVFHEGGYRANARGLLFGFELGVYIGANGLQDAGMTATGAKAIELGVPPYPHMIKWLRD